MMEESGTKVDSKEAAPPAKSSHENDGKSKYGHRDVIGYGKRPVQPHWPNKAKVALNFVINYEEGGEMCTLHGDSASEHLLSDIPNAVPHGTPKSFNRRVLVA
jgi:hypothetical protein